MFTGLLPLSRGLTDYMVMQLNFIRAPSVVIPNGEDWLESDGVAVFTVGSKMNVSRSLHPI